MDECKLYELFDLLELVPYSSSISNNQMRYIVWASLKPYLKKKNITPDELMPFVTDKENLYVEEEKEEALKDSEVELLRKIINEQFRTPKKKHNKKKLTRKNA